MTARNVAIVSIVVLVLLIAFGAVLVYGGTSLGHLSTS